MNATEDDMSAINRKRKMKNDAYVGSPLLNNVFKISIAI